MKLAIRTETGFKTSGETKIFDANDTNDRWKFSLTEDGNFEDSIIIADEITDKNKIFYAKVFSANDELPGTDREVSLKVTAIIGAAE